MIKNVLCAFFALLIVASCGNGPAHAEQQQTIENEKAEYHFELPVAGTTGYGVVDLNLRSEDSAKSSKLGVIPAGAPFLITGEGGAYFPVEYNGTAGYVSKNYTMVNLPDLIPSIRYNATNSYGSLFRSCKQPMPGLTGESLYSGKTKNEKLGYEEYNMPVLWTMAKKLSDIQSAMLADGYTIILYEAYRPADVQKRVNTSLESLMKSNGQVKNAILHGGWSKSWFIAKNISNHQRGYAVDISMARIDSVKVQVISGRNIKMPAQYTELDMPTDMHELSPAAASMAYGVNSMSPTAWKSVPLANTMTDSSRALRKYCVDGGLSPLASEWWHWNCLDSRAGSGGIGTGDFHINDNVSKNIG